MAGRREKREKKNKVGCCIGWEGEIDIVYY